MNIEVLLTAKGVSADALSKKAKHVDAIRNLRRRVAGEFRGSWTLDTLGDIAAALETTPWELLRPASAERNDREYVLSILREELDARAPAAPVRKRG